jgi:ABC-type microcin C transport system permease subunit YejE
MLFSYIYILIRIISLTKALRHTKKKNERNKRGLYVDTWVFLTLLRVYVVNHLLKNAKPPLKFTFRKC